MFSPLLSFYMFALSWPNYGTADDGYFFSLSVPVCSCLLVYLLFPACFGRLVNKALWESVCCALSHITKATEPLPPLSWQFRELYESVCTHGSVFMGLTSKHMLILYRGKNIWRFSRKEHACSEHKLQKQSQICRKVMVIYCRKCLYPHLDADLYLFMHFFLKPALLTCRGIGLVCLLCTTSIVFFSACI